MLYLLKLDSCYKIGYTKNIQERIKHLSVTHLEVELISTKHGDKNDEKEIHKLCRKYKIKNELFQINNEVEKIFNTYISIHIQQSINNTLKTQRSMIETYQQLAITYEKILTLSGCK